MSGLALGVLLISVMLILLAFGIPVAFSMGLSCIFFLLVTGAKPLILLAQQSIQGVDSFVMLAIPMFTMAGYLMESGGLSKRLVNCMDKIFSRSVGGVGTVTIVCCAVFAALTGSAPATVIAIGSIMTPALLSAGYSRSESAGMLSAAGALGPIIPPRICMIVYASTMNTSVVDMFAAAIVPGVFMALMLVITNIIIAKKRRRVVDASVLPTYTKQEILHALLEAIPVLILPIIILGGIYGGIFTPTEAGATALVYALILGFVYKELNLKKITTALSKTVASCGMVMFIMAMSADFSYLLSVGRIPTAIATAMVPLLKSKVIFLVVMEILLLVAGCFIEVLACVVIFAPIIVPIGLQFGLDPLHLGIAFCITLVIGVCTPPFGMNLYTAVPVCKTSFSEVCKGILPYLFCLVLCAFIIAFVPQISLFLPALLK